MQQLMENEGEYMEIKKIAMLMGGDNWMDFLEQAKEMRQKKLEKEMSKDRFMSSIKTPSRDERRAQEKKKKKGIDAITKREIAMRIANDPYLPKKKRR